MNYQDFLFIGVDTHKNQHTAAIISCFHQKLGAVQTPNNPANFDEFIKELEVFITDQETLVFGLEDTQGLGRSLAQWLVKHGYTVKEVNPALTKRERDHSSNPDKSDLIDAEAIANVLLSRFDELPQVHKDDNFKALKQLSNHRRNLVKQRTQIKNQLHDLVHQQYPNYKSFFSKPFESISALAFFEEFPHPGKLKYYGEKRLQKFLKKQAANISNDKANEILALVDKEQDEDLSVEARNSLIPMLIKQLRLINEQLEDIETQLQEAVEKSPYRLTTMPGISYNLAAQFISEIGHIDRFDSASHLAKYAGLAPVEYSSGQSSSLSHKKYGCRKLNNAFYLLALQQVCTTRDGMPRNPVAYQYYQKKLAEGKSRKSALVCLQRRLVDIIFAMMRDKTAYKMPEVPDYEVLNEAS
ncbi:IS110 family transposase [Fuchsiella alkaliacetigena]|uniref:IS110 family transposase n=1 Tax=Fuchsiella alkaliacetigena TaxID=957042 RepID=UPI00200A14D7|nr:IS110 family transposase [Fuchsiella alkaliacetigena]MCK8826117.1 IS110 family transposase [Fuchsiella alkaliacetigena]